MDKAMLCPFQRDKGRSAGSEALQFFLAAMTRENLRRRVFMLDKVTAYCFYDMREEKEQLPPQRCFTAPLVLGSLP
ncbi:hypothetical protein EVAR_16445_1 [Eumeta japonica]|uniref:Uncharacterized protein n=1 Tax=Eumeta variegata TaxID=151549 RepID=A0A4C1UKA7_EUMVA|nr:hypothetical protein EVAR_16445_1 [Eumeta japonica]